MSVRTTADEHRDALEQNIKDALNNIHKFLDPEIWGAKEYSEEYLEKVVKAANKLRKIQFKLF